MPTNHLILCHPLVLLPSIFPNIRVFSNESVLCIRWPKYWSFSFNISPSNEHPGLISFTMYWMDLLQFKGLSRVFSNVTVQKHQFFGTQFSLESNSHIHIWLLEKEVKSKGEKERYKHLNADFQRRARRDKKAFFSDQCKEIEENNRMGKTIDLFRKIWDTKGTFHAKMGLIKDRNGTDLREAEDIKKRWQEYTEELYKIDLHDPDTMMVWSPT